MVLGEGRVYNARRDRLRHLQLRQRGADEPARRAQIEAKHGWKVRVVDLRWLQCRSTRPSSPSSAGVGEGIITAIVEAGLGATPLKRVVGADTFTPLAGAAFLVLPGDEEIIAAGKQMAN
jgi:2-oxoisovalerate dehydrogenase E1 component